MTIEQIVSEIKDVMELNREYKRKNNEVLSHAMNALTRENNDYEHGLNDCWASMTRLVNMKTFEREKIFKANSVRDILEEYTPHEVLKRMEHYESNVSKVEFQVGDKVKNIEYGTVGIILEESDVDPTERTWSVYTENNGVEFWCESEIDKTGERADIQSLFKKI